jgi:protein ImuB
VGIRPPDLLYVDIAPTLHLFGEAEILKRTKAYRRAISDDVATAGVLARAGREEPPVIAEGKSEEALAPFPIGTLSFLANPLSPPTPRESKAAAEMIRILFLLGVKTLGDFARIPASTIGPRFGAFGVELHRRARGAASSIFRPFEPSLTYREAWESEEPVSNVEPLLFVTKNLLARLEAQMQKNLESALQMVLYLETEDSKETEVSIPLHRPLRKAPVLFEIVRERLSALTLDSPVISMAIEISLPVRSRGTQFHLFDAHEQQSERLDELLGRLVGKLGPTVVSAAALRERHRPETAWEAAAFEPRSIGDTLKGVPMRKGVLLGRPTLILPSPQPLRLERREGGSILHSERERFVVRGMKGPERLAGEWWSEKPLARDYFVAETKGGEQLWIFQNHPDRQLFLHGYFD